MIDDAILDADASVIGVDVVVVISATLFMAIRAHVSMSAAPAPAHLILIADTRMAVSRSSCRFCCRCYWRSW